MSEQKVYAPDDEKSNGFNLLAGENLVFADGENMWQSLLQRVTSQATQRDKVLLVLGDRDSGAAELISKFSDSARRGRHHGGRPTSARPGGRSTLGRPASGRSKMDLTTTIAGDSAESASTKKSPPHENMMRFHYRSIRSTEEADRGDVISRLDIVEVFNRDVRANLPLLLDDILPTSPEDLMLAIVVDVSEPSKVASSLSFWSEFVHDLSKACETRWSGDMEGKAKDKISSHIQFYVDPTLGSDQQISKAERAATAVDRSTPEINFGVPLFVVGTRADLLVKSLGTMDAPKRIEGLSHQLRRFCLPYGASLLFTLAGTNPKENSGTMSSLAVGASPSRASVASQDSRQRGSTTTSTSSSNTNASTTFVPSATTTAQLFHDYVVHRLYGMDFSQPPRAFGGSVDEYEMAAIFIPSGFDTENLIKATEVNTNPAADTGEANGDASAAAAGAKQPAALLKSIDRLFPAGTGRSSDPISAEPKAEERVSLPASAAFLEHMRGEIDRSGLARSSTSSRSSRKGDPNALKVPTSKSGGSASTRSSTSARDSDRLARAAAAAAAGGSLSKGGSIGRARGASGTPRSGTKGDNVAVKNFFQSLLNSSGSRASAPTRSRDGSKSKS